MQLRRLAAITTVALTAASSLAACGSKEEPRVAKTEGVYVTTGDLKYQVQISRQLNAADFEDRDYLVGLPAADRTLPKGQEWFAIFVRVFNMTDASHPAASRFVIRDTTGKAFTPIPVDTRVNRVAYKAVPVGSGDQIPVPGSQARENATQGGLVLFRIPSSSYANRPLELHIAPPDGGQEAIVDLDV